ncbi:MAG: sulfatase-like hydrolase/transferase [Chitinophagaceae bacterium]|nr:sulfatase-like hydrolase/transferase [Chitinophagaceae bacterium]
MKPIINRPFYPFLLVIFFFLHALLENYNPVLIKTAGWLIVVYSIATIILLVLFKLLLKDWRKAALPAFSLMAFNFFFGSIYDLLKKNFHDAFITKLSFILALTLILLVILFIYLKRTDRKLLRTTHYLNLLFILLIVLDAGALLAKSFKGKKQPVADLSKTFTECDTCARPDIYLIITDEYAGNTELKELFAFDNSAFENELKTRGFHIINNSVSNYNATVYSMASILNMDHISHLNRPSLVNHKDMLLCRGLIQNNNLAGFLKKNGYTIYNYSFFDMGGKTKAVNNLYFSSNKLLLTGQTFIRRMIRNAGARFASKEKIDAIKKNDLYNDIRVDSLTRQVVLQKNSSPKFVYTHLNMPHPPYFYDSSGREISTSDLTDESAMKKNGYIEYLHYTNRKLLSLVDFIKKNSVSPPVILLLGDHGFRQLPAGTDQKYYFMNLNSVYFPNGNYTGFYDGLSTVNQFRIILNTLFAQKLSLVKDSTSFLKE